MNDDWLDERRADIAARLRGALPVFENRVHEAHTKVLDEEGPMPVLIVDVPAFRRQRRDATQPSFRTTVEIKIAIITTTVATEAAETDQARLSRGINKLRAAVENTLLEDAEWVRQWESFEDGDWETVPLDTGERFLLAGVLTLTAVLNEDFAPVLRDGLQTVEIRRPGNSDALGVDSDRLQKLDLPTARDGQGNLRGEGALVADAD